jgi:aromatic-L-amino-acid/L-tryptophan decarboxylase
VTFREDGAAAVEWAARYLERVGDFPVLAQVEPGDIRSRLPAAPPERGESFVDVLRDLDEILLPGITHWQSPRFFAYFANSSAEPGILAELLAATLNSVAFIWRTSPASTELEAHTLDWAAQLLGLPSGWHGHIEDTASISTIAALAAAREANRGHVVVCSEEARSSVERAARLLGLETRKVPLDAEFRLDPAAVDLTDAAALVATVGTTSTTAVDPVPVLADACEAAGVWLHVDAAYAGSAWVCPGAALVAGRCGARGLARRQRAQVAVPFLQVRSSLLLGYDDSVLDLGVDRNVLYAQRQDVHDVHARLRELVAETKKWITSGGISVMTPRAQRARMRMVH